MQGENKAMPVVRPLLNTVIYTITPKHNKDFSVFIIAIWEPFETQSALLFTVGL